MGGKAMIPNPPRFVHHTDYERPGHAQCHAFYTAVLALFDEFPSDNDEINMRRMLVLENISAGRFDLAVSLGGAIEVPYERLRALQLLIE